MIFILSSILFLLLILVGRTRGLKTFGILYLSIFLIMVYIFMMTLGFNAIINAVIICILVTIITLFGLNGVNIKTKSSFKLLFK